MFPLVFSCIYIVLFQYMSSLINFICLHEQKEHFTFDIEKQKATTHEIKY